MDTQRRRIFHPYGPLSAWPLLALAAALPAQAHKAQAQKAQNQPGAPSYRAPQPNPAAGYPLGPGGPPRPESRPAPRYPAQAAPGRNATNEGNGYGPPGPRNLRDVVDPRQQLEKQLRDIMTGYGCGDAATQDAVLTYIQQEVRARQPVRFQGQRFYQALAIEGMPEDRLREMLTSFHTTLEADRKRREAAEAALDAKINYSKNPRLEGMLLMFGVLGGGPFLFPLNSNNSNRPQENRPSYGPPLGLPGGPDSGPGGTPAKERPNLVKAMSRVLVQRFDKDGDGRLNDAERAQALAFVKSLEANDQPSGQPAPALPPASLPPQPAEPLDEAPGLDPELQGLQGIARNEPGPAQPAAPEPANR